MNLVSLVRLTASTFIREPGRPMAVKALPAFDGLRGYMAWWVVIGHGLQLCGIENRWVQLLLHAEIAVNIFVCLSGFVITHLLLEKHESYATYLTRRVFRIFPIYWLSLGCALALTAAYNHTYLGEWVMFRDIRIIREAAVAANFNTHLTLHVPLIHGLIPENWLPYSSGAFLGPAWSLSLEWQFYLVAPIIITLITQGGWSRIVILLALACLWIYFKKFSDFSWQYPSFLPLSLNFFAIGILSRTFMPLLIRAGHWIVAGSVVAALFAPHSMKIEMITWGIFLFAACAELRTHKKKEQGLTAKKSLLETITSNRIITYLGKFSYSTYLIHIPLFSLAGWLASGLMRNWTQEICIYSTIVATIFLVPISILLFQFIEQPFIRLGARITQLNMTKLKPS